MLFKRLVWFHQLGQRVSFSIGSMTTELYNIISARSGVIAIFKIFVTSEYYEHFDKTRTGVNGLLSSFSKNFCNWDDIFDILVIFDIFDIDFWNFLEECRKCRI